MSIPGAHERIRAAVLTRPGIEARPHRFGGTEYRLGNREVGHLHDIARERQARRDGDGD